ncbi:MULTISPECIES: beta-ketoacyl-ACP synthase III [unclassified Enterococcus]|uniref:beta-ketoacyl-ACP synthase III n=1 Tax=unclassified Enterococcus TaxID=2608891 RepID=UPI001555D7D6|nr:MULTISPECIES: beta-ketoacyl-ACP synthase III [unclassified Enterococcus]MBS7577290.1 ketoacyl-ACP synthase III [Enterococcus sp. MMGLQ5-2]MBS7584617.1 ketoacyl-ACP synthase III [Enterococcus sp. MMGLQ5-1]NPD12472.1 ketoacyl-ACP synthase III [Enterococcus sp. MMGLQ5-1]NPD37124.1 ketoacyl-ACP synthase III [Enterococcus sp. MMGLQ5-2]
MNFAKITQVAHYAPAQVVTNDDLAAIMDTNDEWISSRTGIKSRHITYDENTSDLCINIVQSLLKKSGDLPEAIDFLIIATISPDSLMPTTATITQGKTGLVNAFAFDMQAACSGFIYALSLGEKLIASGRYKKGIVIGAETHSKTLDWDDRSTAVLFGDGAGGVLLEADNQQHFLAEKLQSDGIRGLALTAKTFYPKSPYSKEFKANEKLTMDGRSVFDFAVREVPQNILATLELAGIEADEIDYYLPHQANVRIIDKWPRKLKVDPAKFLVNLENYGNTSAASIPILLSEAIDKGTLSFGSGQNVLLTGFGGGLTWGSLIIKL